MGRTPVTLELPLRWSDMRTAGGVKYGHPGFPGRMRPRSRTRPVDARTCWPAPAGALRSPSNPEAVRAPGILGSIVQGPEAVTEAP